jgi:hypothetical protein
MRFDFTIHATRQELNRQCHNATLISTGDEPEKVPDIH